MPQKILQNTALDKQLLKEGYVVVPFLNEDEVKQLVDFFHTNHPQGINGFYATAHVPDIGFRQKMNEYIKGVFQRAIDENFDDCRPLGGSFVVKSSSQTERLHPHQDWNIVDENKYRSFNIWVPLVDLTSKNGIIKVTPGSHRWTKTYRGPNLPDIFDQVHESIWDNMKPLHMKAGEALIYDHRLFHASDPNTTDQLRIAAVYGIIPNEASMYYYFGNEEKVEIYESSPDFFLNEDIQRGPEILPLKEKVPMRTDKVSGLKLSFYKLASKF